MELLRDPPRRDAAWADEHPPLAPLGLTRREAETILAIQRLARPDGVSPSYQEIAEATGFAKSRVWGIVEQLERKGWLVKTGKFGQYRRLELLRRLPDRRAEALDVADEHRAWAMGRGDGLLRILDALEIEHPAEIAEAEAVALIAEYWLRLRCQLEAKERGHG